MTQNPGWPEPPDGSSEGAPGSSAPDQPASGQPAPEQPGAEQPAAEQPGVGQPTYGQPTYGQPTYGQPTYGQSSYDPSGYAPPPGYDPAYAQQGYQQPAYGYQQPFPAGYGYDPAAPYGIEPRSGIPYSDKSKLIAGLLQVLLPLGIGRFYMGQNGLGIAQLLVTVFTCGIGAIWPFIDGIIILVGDPRDVHGRPLRS
jgi:TM2 domain-containing membrane protein YozV